MRSSIFGADVNGDSKIDLLVGNYRGGVNFFDSKITGIEFDQQQLENTINLYPNPATSFVNIQIANDYVVENIEAALFDLLGNENPLTNSYRKKLMTAIY